MIDTLYIIGNGFDLHHGLKTAYSDFRKNLASKRTGLWNLLHDVYGDSITKDMWWSNFEEMLGKIDYLNLINSYNGEALGSAKVAKLLKGTLPPLFGKWINEMNCSAHIDNSLCINPNSYFFTFNYTLLLEDCYHVRSTNVWHIHNSISNIDDIVVGHDSDDRKLFMDYLEYIREKKSFSIDIANSIWREAINGAKKVENRIYLNKDRFCEQYSNIKHYILMGFSFNDIDSPYIKEIISVNSNISIADWKIYYHNEDEDIVIINKLLELGINRGSIINPIKW